MFSQTAEYALRAVACLARSDVGTRATVHDLAGRTRVPEGYLAKVVRQLVGAGIVDSQRGRGGGFTLARPVERISVLDVIDAVDPFPRIDHCPLGLHEHHDQLCALHQRMEEQLRRTRDALGSTSFGDLLRAPGPVWPLGIASSLPRPTNEEERDAASGDPHRREQV